jgi:phage baseplate assembly protein W
MPVVKPVPEAFEGYLKVAGAIQYRVGMDALTGGVLVGMPHMLQSLGMIWETRLETVPMLLDFGSNLRGLLAEDVEPAIALAVYNELVISAALWEPEYEIAELQLVRLTEGGALGVRHGGIYYPEGRLGNYDIAVPVSPVARSFGRASA